MEANYLYMNKLLIYGNLLAYRSNVIADVREDAVDAIWAISAHSDRDDSSPFRQLFLCHILNSLLNFHGKSLLGIIAVWAKNCWCAISDHRNLNSISFFEVILKFFQGHWAFDVNFVPLCEF